MQSVVNTDTRAIRRWLYACATMVFLIVVVGGITRLTRSGLSIVEWKPISGTLPPLNDTEWNIEFSKYQETPEYKIINHKMTLSEFKDIFWWEFIHRTIARLIGVVFFFPFVYFLLRRRLSAKLAIKLLLIFSIGALQGFMGWYMVKSGLVKDPHVSHLRLMLHLMLAVLLYMLLLTTSWRLKWRRDPNQKASAEHATMMAAFFILATGALVAGLKAGKMYNTWPLMNGAYYPPGIEYMTPWYLNLYEHPALVQFIHRNAAYAFGAWLLVFCYRRRREIFAAPLRHPLTWLVVVYALQVLLGVLTLLQVVPVGLAAKHQMNALILFTVALYMFIRRQSVADKV
ncbi:MAG TPA: COX15/CtaA family protein [Turneriella sp.]|nr:COX15/CtaA family protein [Turneriella sp.]